MSDTPLSTSAAFIAALNLPLTCRVDQRIPKKMLIENGTNTSADKRLITDTVEECLWIAAIKPSALGLSAYRDDVREYLEIALLCLTLRVVPTAVQLARLAELLHRAVPYPVLLLLQSPQSPPLLWASVAHKRWAHNEADKMVLDGDVLLTPLTAQQPPNIAATISAAFHSALDWHAHALGSVLSLYEGWMACLVALETAHHTGIFQLKNDTQGLIEKRKQLQKINQLNADAARLRTRARQTKQLAEQVELNLALQRVQAQLRALHAQL